MGNPVINRVTFEKQREALLCRVTFEKALMRPVLCRITFEVSEFNFNCIVTDKNGNALSGVVATISDGVDTVTYTSDSTGLIEGKIRKNIETTIILSKPGYKNDTFVGIITDNDSIFWQRTLYKIISIIYANGKQFISANPTEQDNQIYN